MLAQNPEARPRQPAFAIERYNFDLIGKERGQTYGNYNSPLKRPVQMALSPLTELNNGKLLDQRFPLSGTMHQEAEYVPSPSWKLFTNSNPSSQLATRVFTMGLFDFNFIEILLLSEAGRIPEPELY